MFLLHPTFIGLKLVHYGAVGLGKVMDKVQSRFSVDNVLKQVLKLMHKMVF